MGNCENCQGNNGVGAGFKTASILLLIAIVGLLGFLAYNQFTENKLLDNSYVEYEKTPTIEEAMYEWNEQKESAREYAVYINLPASIVQALYEKLGTQCNVSDYVKEYESNSEYYVSLQIAKQLQESGLKDPGIDGKRLKNVEIKTELEPTPVEKPAPIPAVPKDTTRVSHTKPISNYFYDIDGGYYYTQSKLS